MSTNRLRRRNLPFLTLVGVTASVVGGLAWLRADIGLAGAPPPPEPHPLEAQGAEVRRGKAIVADGDTLVIGGRGLRLFGIDAPDYDTRCTMDGADMALGHLSYHALDTLVMGREVVCYVVEPRPSHPSDVAVCEAGGVELNTWMVRAGWARSWAGDGHTFAKDEGRARGLHAGLWACEQQIEPWSTKKGR